MITNDNDVRFLGSPSGSLVIDEDTTLLEHGLATVACLLSGLNVFNTTYSEQNRQYRVLKGIHGLHVYATEFWTDYLLSRVEVVNGSDANSHLLTLACTLAEKLDKAGGYSPPGGSQGNVEELDKRLGCLLDYPVLLKHVRSFLKARSLKTLEAQLLASNGKFMHHFRSIF